MYYHTPNVNRAKLIHKKHPKTNLDAIVRLIKIGLGEEDCGVNTAIYVPDNNVVEYCNISFYKSREPRYGTQGKLTRTIKY